MSTMPPRPFLVAGRFCGPPGSGNGGYTAGRLASYLAEAGTIRPGSQPVTVTLRRPPPLDSMMEVRPSPDDEAGGAELWLGDVVIASATPGAFRAGVVAPVDLETATAARALFRGTTHHPFPSCFVCGPERATGAGMRLTPGLIGPGSTACVWMPDPSIVDAEPSVVGPEFAWAALDCPGGWTSDLEHRPMVLGRMTASCPTPPRVGQPHIVVGQLLSQEGRKTFTATSLYDAGRLIGRAEHTWIAVDPTTFPSR